MLRCSILVAHIGQSLPGSSHARRSLSQEAEGPGTLHPTAPPPAPFSRLLNIPATACLSACVSRTGQLTAHLICPCGLCPQGAHSPDGEGGRQTDRQMTSCPVEKQSQCSLGPQSEADQAGGPDSWTQVMLWVWLDTFPSSLRPTAMPTGGRGHRQVGENILQQKWGHSATLMGRALRRAGNTMSPSPSQSEGCEVRPQEEPGSLSPELLPPSPGTPSALGAQSPFTQAHQTQCVQPLRGTWPGCQTWGPSPALQVITLVWSSLPAL